MVDRMQGWQLVALEVLEAWARLWKLGFPQEDEGRKGGEWSETGLEVVLAR